LDQKEHLLVAMINQLTQLAYWSRIAALKGLDRSQQAQLIRAAPKPLLPGKKKVRFSTPTEIAAFIRGRGVVKKV